MAQAVYLQAAGLATPAGGDLSSYLAAHLAARSALGPHDFPAVGRFPVAPLHSADDQALAQLRQENKYYRKLDRSVLMGLLAARRATAGFAAPAPAVVNLAASRGATAVWEAHHRQFVQEPAQRLSPFASPTTTLGNLSSWVLQDLGWHGAADSHSITCSSALFALANAKAWLQAGMAQTALAGAAEAPLTAFTMAQMHSLGVLAPADHDSGYPCRPFGQEPSGMALGEGAALFRLSTNQAGALARLGGIGFASEALPHPAGISPAGANLAASMRSCLGNGPPPDLVLAHAPGTQQGDTSEWTALESVFGSSPPPVYSNKWLMGHTLGAAGALNVALALALLGRTEIPQLPYPHQLAAAARASPPLRRLMINAVGFGGVAASVMIESLD